MTADTICPRCNSCPETIIHVLRDCEETANLWSKVIDAANWSKFFSLGLVPWLEWKVPWSWMSFFTITIDCLWRDRICLVFSNETKLGDGLWQQICS